MKLIGMIRSKELQSIEVEAVSVEDARPLLDALVPEGWELQHIRIEK